MINIWITQNQPILVQFGTFFSVIEGIKGCQDTLVSFGMTVWTRGIAVRGTKSTAEKLGDGNM